jgi:alpha-D-ribose 1-methylphosphonate 5-triphosphate synthase subunit PhnH
MAHMSNDLSPGFADPVAGAQACFRAVLDAMARPGRVMAVSGVAAPAPLCDAAAAVLLTLVDHETPLWLDPDAAAARNWIAFHTGAPVGGALMDGAAFVMALSLPDLAALPAGTDEMPETSATVILQVKALGSGRRYVLEGPGLRRATELRVDGLPADFVSNWQHNHGLFPRGVDLILCAGRSLAALPRSVSVSEG